MEFRVFYIKRKNNWLYLLAANTQRKWTSHDRQINCNSCPSSNWDVEESPHLEKKKRGTRESTRPLPSEPPLNAIDTNGGPVMRADYPWHGSWPSPPEMSAITSFHFFDVDDSWAPLYLHKRKKVVSIQMLKTEGHAENNERLETGAATISWMNKRIVVFFCVSLWKRRCQPFFAAAARSSFRLVYCCSIGLFDMEKRVSSCWL